jgi:hypothetical protein
LFPTPSEYPTNGLDQGYSGEDGREAGRRAGQVGSREGSREPAGRRARRYPEPHTQGSRLRRMA